MSFRSFTFFIAQNPENTIHGSKNDWKLISHDRPPPEEKWRLKD